MMSIFSSFFKRKQPQIATPIPPWEEIVEHMQGKGLSGFSDSVATVIYSKDRSKRIIILQSENGYFKTIYEEIRVFDEDEWVYFCNDPGAYPAWWEPTASSINTKSFYASETDALKEIMSSFEYKAYFE